MRPSSNMKSGDGIILSLPFQGESGGVEKS